MSAARALLDGADGADVMEALRARHRTPAALSAAITASAAGCSPPCPPRSATRSREAAAALAPHADEPGVAAFETDLDGMRRSGSTRRIRRDRRRRGAARVALLPANPPPRPLQPELLLCARARGGAPQAGVAPPRAARGRVAAVRARARARRPSRWASSAWRCPAPAERPQDDRDPQRPLHLCAHAAPDHVRLHRRPQEARRGARRRDPAPVRPRHLCDGARRPARAAGPGGSSRRRAAVATTGGSRRRSACSFVSCVPAAPSTRPSSTTCTRATRPQPRGDALPAHEKLEVSLSYNAVELHDVGVARGCLGALP